MRTEVNNHRRPTGGQIATGTFLALAVMVALFPILWVIMSSFKTNQEILSSGISLPASFSFEGYRQALAISPLLQYFGNSVAISLAATALNVFLISLAAYVFARYDFKAKNLIYNVLMISMMVPVTALLSPIFKLVTDLNLYDTRSGLVLIYTGLNLALSLMIMRNGYANVPASIEDAARVDGAGFVRTYAQIMTPIAKSSLASAAVLAFLNNWNEFTFALTVTGSQNVRTLPLALSYFTSQFSFNYTALFAAITMSVLPSILVFAIFQEQVIKSMTAGAVKG